MPELTIHRIFLQSTIEPTCHQSLIRSPIRRTMVPGIRGERVAQEVQFIRNIKRAHDTRGQHKLCGLPERLGSVTGKANLIYNAISKI